MITQKERVEIFINALVNPTVSICAYLGFDLARDLKIDTALWLYVMGWFVLFVNAFYRERRKALRKLDGVR